MSAPFPTERNMLLRCVKNYFVSLKHYFAPLGAFALGVILGISVLIPGLISSVRALADSVVQITGSVSFDLGAFVECLADEIGGLDWSDPSAAIGTVFGSGWLADAFNDCIHSLVPGGEAYAAQIEQAVALAVAEWAALAIVFVFMSALGLLCAFLLTRFLVKRTIAKRVWWINILSALFDVVFVALTGAAVVWLAAIWPPSIYISAVVLTLLYIAVALTKGYVIFGRKVMPLSETVNIKNIGVIVLSDIIIALITAAFVAASFLLTNNIAGIFISMPFVFIGLQTVEYNAEAYVKAVAENYAEGKAAEQA